MVLLLGGIHYSSLALLALLCLAAAAAYPRISMLLFLCLLSMFGNRPGSTQALALLLVTSGLILGVFIRLSLSFGILKARSHSDSLVAPHWGVRLLVLYTLASVLSLIGLPWDEIAQQFLSQLPSIWDLSAVSYALRPFLSAREEQWQYVLLSVYWTVSSCTLALSIIAISRQHRTFPMACGWALLCGLLLSLCAGLLDYYGLIDLRSLRALDPVVNPGDRQFRLQSFFGHSGWFAEFVTLSAPLVLLLLLLKRSFALRVTLIVTALLVGEFVLILTFQRGGWISYPLTLLVVWSAVYITRKLERGEKNVLFALRSSALKIALTLPITVIISLCLVSALTRMGLLGSESTFHLSDYVQRFSDIQKTSDRTDFMRAGWKLGLLQPFLGNGSESFAYQYRREFESPQGRYYKEIILPLHGSAHNVYLQTFAGKGALGLITLLALPLVLICCAIRAAVREAYVSNNDRVVLLATSSALIAFLIYGHVQEIFYVQSLQFIFFALCAVCLSTLPCALEPSRSVWSAVWGALAVCIFAALLTRPWPRTVFMPYGCFGEETDEHGGQFRWCGPHSRHIFKEVPADASGLILTIQMGDSSYANNQVTVQASMQGTVLSEIAVERNSTYQLEIPLPEGSTRPTPLLVDITTASYFIPARDIRAASDPRILSYRLISTAWKGPVSDKLLN